jgi:chromosome segregation ATPase
LQKKNQQLKGERNNFKQKNDSLSKEISRLCKDGRSIRDIEKIVADHEALLHEVEILRSQKRKALEDAHTYRQAYEQVKAAEELHGTEEDTRRALERSAELERLLSEMTDYVHAKEMQLETLKQVNEALQDEIKNLARASFHKNDV